MQSNGEINSDDDIKLSQNEQTHPLTGNSQNTQKDVEFYGEIEETLTPNARKDLFKIIMLCCLYFLQSLPMGLCASMPLLMTDRNISYYDQGLFSLAFFPYSTKLLWAPLIDSIYVKKFGRRKSWLIPCQLLNTILLFSTADRIQYLLDNYTSKTDIMILSGIFFIFVFISATHDVALDGWGITILSKENLSWQASCNMIGGIFGFLMGFIVFINLESAKVSNEYIRPIFGLNNQPYGVFSLKMFMLTLGVLFLITTIFLIIFVNEDKFKSSNAEEEPSLNVFSTYKIMWKLLKLAPMRKLIPLLLTLKIGSATDAAVGIKLIERGVSKELLTLTGIPTIPVILVWTVVTTKFIGKSKSLLFFNRIFPFKLLTDLIGCVFIYYLPFFQDSNGEYGYFFFVSYYFVNLFDRMLGSSIGLAFMSYFSYVSEEKIGGTYITFLTTIMNLGSKWPGTLSLFLINSLTTKDCSIDKENNLNLNKTMRNLILNSENSCSSIVEKQECTKIGGTCITIFDSYYSLTIVCIVIAFIWFIIFRKTFSVLNSTPKSKWAILKK